MSHTVKIKTKFYQELHLKAALAALGWSTKENSKIRNYPQYGRGPGNNTFDFIGVNPGRENSSYDVGFTRSETAGPDNQKEIESFADFYGGSIERSLGAGLEKLTDNYAERVAIQNFQGQSMYLSQRNVTPDGAVHLQFTTTS